jgi:hypothetical protein
VTVWLIVPMIALASMLSVLDLLVSLVRGRSSVSAHDYE